MTSDPILLQNPELNLTGWGWIRKRILQQFAGISAGRLRVLFDDGRSECLSGDREGPEAEIRIHKPLAFARSVTLGGDLGFGESYMRREWSSDDLSGLLHLLSSNLDELRDSERRSLPVRALGRLRHALNHNSLRGSRRNIASHYDLGNAFYARWLDPSMSYSAAIFEGGDDLFDAQQRKYQRMLDLIDPEPGAHILEIGCGWGGFAEYAARRGLRVTGITLSREQFDFARARVRDAGLQDRVEILLRDYRHLRGEYDHIVSIEMFEAVGQRYWQTYFDSVAARLRPGGRAAFQIITIREDLFERYVSEAGGFIQKYIFPGGMLPSERHLNAHAAAAGLSACSMERFGEDYADTLAEWHANFAGETAWLEEHGYDERFRRMWAYYLAFCEAGFRDGRIDLVHFSVAREARCAS